VDTRGGVRPKPVLTKDLSLKREREALVLSLIANSGLY